MDLRRAFRVLDANRDGKISRAEFAAGLARAMGKGGHGMSQSELETLFNFFDPNRTGNYFSRSCSSRIALKSSVCDCMSQVQSTTGSSWLNTSTAGSFCIAPGVRSPDITAR
jgi:hypothetical protein